MKFNCEIEVLSPVHIGSGDLLTPMDYVVSNGNFAKFALDRYLSSKSGNFATEFLTKLENQIREKRGRVSLTNLLKGEESNQSFWDWSIPVESSAESLIMRLVNGSERGRLLDFYTFIRDSNGTPIIPGSSIKGALRTAFAYWLLRQKDFSGIFQNIRQLRQNKYGKLQVSNKLDEIEDFFRDISSPDAKNDVLKFLQISDFYPSSSNPTSAVYSRIMSAQPGDINKYSFTKNRNPRYSFFEAVLPAKAVFKGSIKTELDMLKDIKIYSWNESVKNCLNQITRAANDLSLKEIAFDSYFLNKYVSPVEGEKELDFIYENYYKVNEIRKRMGVNECILRMGAGGGWHSKTIGLHLYNHDSKTGNFEQMDVLLELKKRIRGSKIPQEFPKTRRIVFMRVTDKDNKIDEIPAFPMGWIKLKLTKVSENPCSTA